MNHIISYHILSYFGMYISYHIISYHSHMWWYHNRMRHISGSWCHCPWERRPTPSPPYCNTYISCHSISHHIIQYNITSHQESYHNHIIRSIIWYDILIERQSWHTSGSWCRCRWERSPTPSQRTKRHASSPSGTLASARNPPLKPTKQYCCNVQQAQ